MGAAPTATPAATSDTNPIEHSGGPNPALVQGNLYRMLNQVIMTHYGENLPQSQQPLVDAGERLMRPRMQLYESKVANVAVASLELPGMHKTDVQVTVRDDELIITGERHPVQFPDRPGRAIVNELKFGKFLRVIHLPTGTKPTSISASMDDGMLTISWPLIPPDDDDDDESRSTASPES